MINSPLTKTLSFATVHFTVAFTLAYLLTGSLIVGGLLALVEPMCNTVAYHIHEKAWARRLGSSAASRCRCRQTGFPTATNLNHRRKWTAFVSA